MITFYDDVNLDLIPATATALATYIDGRYANYDAARQRFPSARLLTIAVWAKHDADCLDVEPSDATNVEAPDWVKRQQARGLARPVLYTSVSNARSLLGELAISGIPRTAIRLWTAHYTGIPHLCGPQCGYGLNTTADATQWTDRALGRSLDQSLAVEDFFAGTGSPTSPPRSDDMNAYQAQAIAEVASRAALGRPWGSAEINAYAGQILSGQAEEATQQMFGYPEAVSWQAALFDMVRNWQPRMTELQAAITALQAQPAMAPPVDPAVLRAMVNEAVAAAIAAIPLGQDAVGGPR